MDTGRIQCHLDGLVNGYLDARIHLEHQAGGAVRDGLLGVGIELAIHDGLTTQGLHDTHAGLEGGIGMLGHVVGLEVHVLGTDAQGHHGLTVEVAALGLDEALGGH